MDDSELNLTSPFDTPKEAERRARMVKAMSGLEWFNRLRYGHAAAVDIWMIANEAGVLLPKANRGGAGGLLLDVAVLSRRMGRSAETGIAKAGAGFVLLDYVPQVYGMLDLRQPEHDRIFRLLTESGVWMEYWSRMVQIDR